MTSDFNLTSLRVPTSEIVASLLVETWDVRLRLSGWSMKPLIPSGSLVRFSSREEPRLGDVVLVHHPRKLVAHRVVALDDFRIWTKGDSCKAADAPVARRQVIGRAVAIDAPHRLPIGNVWMRRLGLVVNRVYPTLVRAYRFFIPREQVPCQT